MNNCGKPFHSVKGFEELVKAEKYFYGIFLSSDKILVSSYLETTSQPSESQKFVFSDQFCLSQTRDKGSGKLFRFFSDRKFRGTRQANLRFH